MDKVVVKYFGVAVMEELMAWFSGPLPRPTNQTSAGIWFQREIG